MEKGPPSQGAGDGITKNSARQRSLGRRTRDWPLPAVVAVVLVVLAGTSGTVLLARDAGGPPDSSSSAPKAAVSTPSPSAPPTAPATTAAPAPSASSLPATTGSRPSPSPSATPKGPILGPAPVYAGPSPQPLANGPTPPSNPPDSRVTPDRLSWGFTAIGQTAKQQKAVVVNAGGQSLHVFPVGITGDNSGDFQIVSGGDQCSGADVAPQQECSIAIVYKALTPGDAKAELLVSDDSGGSATGAPTKTSSIPLSGSAG